MNEVKIVRHRGRLFVEQNQKRKLLCSMSPKLAAYVVDGNDIAIPDLHLVEAIPRLVKGECPECGSRLKVESVGRYKCADCETTFVNTEGYKLTSLMADEIIHGAVEGQTVNEFTTVGVAPVMPSGMKTKDGTAKGICPKCYNELSQTGACSLCEWAPTDHDKLWEQILSIVKRMVPVTATENYAVEFESASGSCKIVLEEHEDGYRYVGRLVNITEDSIRELTGRPKAIINFLVDKLQPVRPVNSLQGQSVNTPKQESGNRLSPRFGGSDKHVGTLTSSFKSNRNIKGDI